MRRIYILKESNNISAFYYGENKSIYMDKAKDNTILKRKLIENCSNIFSVSLDKKGKIYILNENIDKSIVLGVGENTESEFSLFNILNDEEGSTNFSFLNALFFDNNISILFNKSLNGKNNLISVKTLLNTNEWTKTENIDNFFIGNNIYEILNINERDAVLVYEKKETELQLGFKEIIEGKISPFYQIHKTGFQIVDFSVLKIGDEIHFLYITKNLFSSQVVYRKKGNYGITGPIILYEGQKIRDCCISFIENELYCMWICTNNIIYSISKDLGNSFSNIMSYKKIVTQDIIKAKFITNDRNVNIILNDIYTDYKNPLNIHFISDICPLYINGRKIEQKNNINEVNNKCNLEFISDFSRQNFNNNIKNINNINNMDNKMIEVNKESENINRLPNVNRGYKTISNESDFMSQFNPNMFDDILKNKNININNSQNVVEIDKEQEFIKNKLKIATEQIREKDMQIISLNKTIQEKQREKLDIEQDLRNKIKRLEEENSKLKEGKNNIDCDKNDIEERVDKNVKENEDSSK